MTSKRLKVIKMMSVGQNDISETQNYYKDTQSELIGNDNNKETQNNKLQKDAKLQQLDTKWLQREMQHNQEELQTT